MHQQEHFRLAISVSKAAEAAGVSRTTLWRAIRSGEIQKIKIGTRALILISDLEKWLQGHKEADI